MAEHAACLARLALADADIEVEELLDAVVLASAWLDAGRGSSGSPPDVADDGTQRRKQGQDTMGRTKSAHASADGDATDTASVWLEEQAGTHAVPGKRVSVGRGAALPDALDIGRALRPLRRPWLSGVRRRLDVDATVEHYTRTGMLVPLLTPAPEPWLEVIVVLDRGTAMAVWDETVRVFTRMLRALAAFRDVRVWRLEHPPGDGPVLYDHHGAGLPLHPDTVHPTQPARRLLLVVSDCAALAWRQDTLWRMLHAWGRTAPVALVNPLPKRLWQRSGLNLPRTTATASFPAAASRLLSYRRPRLLRETQETKPWQALPVMQFDPDQVLTWSRALMRTDPSGCEAVLLPATGRVPLRHHRSGRTALPDAMPAYDQVRAHTEAFTDDRRSPAVRLAVAAAPLGSFTLPVLDVLRDRLVPDATLADTAEFLTAGLLTATRRASADTIYHFHPAASAHLTYLLTRDQLWDTHFALSDHLAAHIQAPHGMPVVFHSPDAQETLPTTIRPIAFAAATTARLLGIEPTERLPETGRRHAESRQERASRARQSGSGPNTPATVGDDFTAAELHRTLARHFRALLARLSDSSTGPERQSLRESMAEATQIELEGPRNVMFPSPSELSDAEDDEERRRREAQLAHQASHDALTDLVNAAEVHRRLSSRLCQQPQADSGGLDASPVVSDPRGPVSNLQSGAEMPDTDTPHMHVVAPESDDEDAKGLAVLFCDLDGFKSINERFGNSAGDAVLIEVARRLNQGVQEGDTVARLDGDKFVILADGLGKADAQDLAVRLRNRIIQPIRAEDRAVRVGVSFGIGWAQCGMTADEVINSVDERMYVEKRSRPQDRAGGLRGRRSAS